MGGYGSGWQGQRKATVEESLTLSASALTRKGVLVTGQHASGQWWWVSVIKTFGTVEPAF